MAQTTEKVEKLTTISARNVKRKTKKKFLEVLKIEEVGGQSDFINWNVELATSSLAQEYFETLRKFQKRLKYERIHAETGSRTIKTA